MARFFPPAINLLTSDIKQSSQTGLEFLLFFVTSHKFDKFSVLYSPHLKSRVITTVAIRELKEAKCLHPGHLSMLMIILVPSSELRQREALMQSYTASK